MAFCIYTVTPFACRCIKQIAGVNGMKMLKHKLKVRPRQPRNFMNFRTKQMHQTAWFSLSLPLNHKIHFSYPKLRPTLQVTMQHRDHDEIAKLVQQEIISRMEEEVLNRDQDFHGN